MIVAPAGTPSAVVDKLHNELKGVMALPDVQRQFIAIGNIPLTSPPPDELARYVKTEIVRWGKVVERAGIAGSQ
jgi:tripartite-type tricarboxylate transporter receptor subunit TctC